MLNGPLYLGWDEDRHSVMRSNYGLRQLVKYEAYIDEGGIHIKTDTGHEMQLHTIFDETNQMAFIMHDWFRDSRYSPHAAASFIPTDEHSFLAFYFKHRPKDGFEREIKPSQINWLIHRFAILNNKLIDRMKSI